MKLKPFIAWAGCLLLASFNAVAGSKGAMNNGLMEIGVTFLYPPTAAQLTLVKGQIQRASGILCDATDGQIRIKKAWLAEGSGALDQGDIWIWPQGGRSGVSFYFNGSGLGTSGSHIDLFQDGLRADIIAHELGHLAFGLGDQYDEQSRWGGPCGIGPSFDSGWTEQSHSIMQQIGAQICAIPDAANPGLFVDAGGFAGCFTDADCAGGQSCQAVLMTELDVSGNFDPLRGDNNGCKAGCGESNCGQNWNSGTARFEATQQFQIHAKSDWQTLKDNYAFVTVPAGLPVAVAPPVCNTAVEFDERVVGTDQVILIIDKSGSMTAPVAPGSTDTRMDYAKAAARAFVQLAGASGGSQVGQVSFSSTPTLDRHLIDLNSGDINTFISTKIDPLSPGGSTAIGDALLSTQFEFQGAATPGRVRTAFLLSDGENNTGSNPRDAAQSLKNQGVRVFTIPVGAEADRSLMSDIAGTTGGSMLEASGGQPLPAIYAELSAKINGYPLIQPRQVQYSRPWIGKRSEIRKRAIESTFDVATGTTELVVFLSSKETKSSDWRTSVYLYDPDNNYLSENSLIIVTDPFFKIVRVLNPKPGSWQFGADSTSGGTIQSYVVIYGKNPNAKCFAGVTKFLYNPGESATILAGAHYGAEIMTGASFSGEVIGPDGTTTPLTMTRDPITGAVSGNFANFTGRGIYSVNVACDVAAGAQQYPGEKTTGPARVLAAVPKFSATSTTYFFYKSPYFPTCADESDNGDCDGDGISNGREPPGDLDGDGLPNRYDSDANGDDIPDIVQGINEAFTLPPWYKPPSEMYPPTTSNPPTTPPTASGASSIGTNSLFTTVVALVIAYFVGLFG